MEILSLSLQEEEEDEPPPLLPKKSTRHKWRERKGRAEAHPKAEKNKTAEEERAAAYIRVDAATTKYMRQLEELEQEAIKEHEASQQQKSKKINSL